MEEQNNTMDAARLAVAAATVQKVGDTPFVIVPDGFKAEDLERHLQNPTRRRGLIKMRDADSFIRYIADESTEQTRIYGQMNPPSFMAVLNDHAGSIDYENAGWRDFRVEYNCPLSVEWKTWNDRSGKPMPQELFAQFIEDNLPDIVSPVAAEMLEISRSLEAKKRVNFASGIRLSNGQNELVYEETISGTAAKGKLTVPEEFTIGIPVLEGGAAYAVTARLRYRIADGGRLVMWYELVRPHKIVEDAAKAVWAYIEDKSSMPIFNGSPF